MSGFVNNEVDGAMTFARIGDMSACLGAGTASLYQSERAYPRR